MRFVSEDHLEILEFRCLPGCPLHEGVQQAARDLFVGSPIGREHLHVVQDVLQCRGIDRCRFPGLVHVGVRLADGAETLGGRRHASGNHVGAPSGAP